MKVEKVTEVVLRLSLDEADCLRRALIKLNTVSGSQDAKIRREFVRQLDAHIG